MRNLGSTNTDPAPDYISDILPRRVENMRGAKTSIFCPWEDTLHSSRPHIKGLEIFHCGKVLAGHHHAAMWSTTASQALQLGSLLLSSSISRHIHTLMRENRSLGGGETIGVAVFWFMPQEHKGLEKSIWRGMCFWELKEEIQILPSPSCTHNTHTHIHTHTHTHTHTHI